LLNYTPKNLDYSFLLEIFLATIIPTPAADTTTGINHEAVVYAAANNNEVLLMQMNYQQLLKIKVS